MALKMKSNIYSPQSQNKTLSIFISASIPDPSRWEGEFDALEITDAVTSLARVALTAGIRIITGAHPSISPLLLYVASELPRRRAQQPMITIYQSRLFENVLPAATRRFEEEGSGEIILTDTDGGSAADPSTWGPALDVMRRRMFRDSRPSGAVFIGGMAGIPDELNLFQEICGRRPPVYAVGQPGGEARNLVFVSPPELRNELATQNRYPALWRRVITHLIDSSSVD